jgi:hypothetical protein
MNRAKNLAATQRDAAGGSRERFSTRELRERCSIARTQQRHYRSWRYQITFAGAGCQHTLSPGKPSVPIKRFQLRTVKSGSPPGAGRGRPGSVVCLVSGSRNLPLCRTRFSCVVCSPPFNPPFPSAHPKRTGSLSPGCREVPGPRS